jgi:hypothetical protein
MVTSNCQFDIELFRKSDHIYRFRVSRIDGEQQNQSLNAQVRHVGVWFSETGQLDGSRDKQVCRRKFINAEKVKEFLGGKSQSLVGLLIEEIYLNLIDVLQKLTQIWSIDVRHKGNWSPALHDLHFVVVLGSFGQHDVENGCPLKAIGKYFPPNDLRPLTIEYPMYCNCS